MSLEKIIKTLGLISGLTIGLFMSLTTFFAAMNVRLAWFPVLYSSFLEHLSTNMLLMMGWIMSILLYISLVRDFFRSSPAAIIDARQLPSNLFYRISGDNIAERDGKVIAGLEAFGNIIGNGDKWNIIAMINKENFPFFMLKEQKEDKKIFSGIYLKITWSQNKTAHNP